MTPEYYPGFAFIILVFKTSTGLPTTEAVNPAIAEETKWQAIVSSISEALKIMSFTWSKVAISAAFIIEFLIMLGPSPVQRPLTLHKNTFTLIILLFQHKHQQLLYTFFHGRAFFPHLEIQFQQHQLDLQYLYQLHLLLRQQLFYKILIWGQHGPSQHRIAQLVNIVLFSNQQRLSVFEVLLQDPQRGKGSPLMLPLFQYNETYHDIQLGQFGPEDELWQYRVEWWQFKQWSLQYLQQSSLQEVVNCLVSIFETLRHRYDIEVVYRSQDIRFKCQLTNIIKKTNK